MDQGVEEFFAVVKGVGDVLAGRGAWCVEDYFLVSRASMTCLLGVELGVEVYFLVSRASIDVLAGRGAGC